MRSATIKGWWYGSEITPVPSRMCRVRSAAVVLPPDQAFKDAAREALTVRAGLAHASV